MIDEAAPPSPSPSRRFVALDFETADYAADSACALALIEVQGGQIEARHSFLIRPPRRAFAFTWVHGLRWADVEHKPTFAELWPRIEAVLGRADFLAAHNAPFDRGVLAACCARAGVAPPGAPMVCTVRVARQAWNLRPANLPAVCRHLGIALQHHDTVSDAEACAKIVIAGGDEHVDAQLNPRRPPAGAGRSRSPRRPRRA